MMTQYILNEQGVPVRATNLLEWANWYHAADRHVADETIGDSRVSTVFLGTDHRFGGDGPPILWETMVFGGKLDDAMDRCSGSREQAEAMHLEMVQRVKASQL